MSHFKIKGYYIAHDKLQVAHYLFFSNYEDRFLEQYEIENQVAPVACFERPETQVRNSYVLLRPLEIKFVCGLQASTCVPLSVSCCKAAPRR
jgi:hypothetical protein